MLLALLVVLTARVAAQEPNALDAGSKALAAGDLATAEALFGRYLKSHPHSAEALSNLAAVHARREQFPEAVALYERALGANPKLTPVHFNIAVAYIRTADYASAATHLRAFLKAYPGEARAHQLLGICLVETGEFEKAIRELEVSLKQDSRDPSVRFSLAYAHARAGNTERAEEILKGLRLAPAQTLLIEAELERRRERYPEAREKFEQVVRLDPQNAAALAAIGRLNLLDNNEAEAVRYLERALAANPRDAESTYQLGVLYDRAGQTFKGIDFLKRALTLRAAYPDPHYHLGRIALREKHYSEALGELQTAAGLLPENDAIRLALGRTYQALGRPADAQREFAEVRRLKAAAVRKQQQSVEAERLMIPEGEPRP